MSQRRSAVLVGVVSVAVATLAGPGLAEASTSAGGDPRTVTCQAPDGPIEVYPPTKNPDGTYIGVVIFKGDGHGITGFTAEDVSFAPDRETGRAPGRADGNKILVPANITQPGRYYTVLYYGNEACQSQAVPLP